MGDLQFNMGVMRFLADHRPNWFTPIVQEISNLGEVRGYLIICILIYVAADKRLAIRLTLLVSLTMGLNHILKILIKNPRPFIREGDYQQRWAVSVDNARDLAMEYSTPSGHAMAAAAFYSFLHGVVRSRILRGLAIVAILMIGLSRPYLGVHYIEDILLGWMIGLAVGLLALRYIDRIGSVWARLAYPKQVSIAIVGSLLLWLVTVAINGGGIDAQPRAFVGYAGIVTGVVIAAPLEAAFVGFDPQSSSFKIKALRYAIALVLAFTTLEGLGFAFHQIAGDITLVGFALQFVRYVAVVIVSMLAAPWLFVALHVGQREVCLEISPAGARTTTIC